MGKTLMTTNYTFPGQVDVYKGKVREVYHLENDLLVMIATDRLSAFDVVMPKGIPYKGQILNQIATKMMKAWNLRMTIAATQTMNLHVPIPPPRKATQKKIP